MYVVNFDMFFQRISDKQLSRVARWYQYVDCEFYQQPGTFDNTDCLLYTKGVLKAGFDIEYAMAIPSIIPFQ